MTPHTTPELPESIEKALKPLYVSGSMDVFNLRVAIEKELHILEQKHRAEVEEIRKAGLQEGSEIVLGAILELLDVAEQDREVADDPEDPKIRVAYLRDKLLRFEILTTTTSERKDAT